MRAAKIGYVVGVACLLFGCSDNAQPESSKDASVPAADAPPDRAPADLVLPADKVADSPLGDVAKDLAVDAPMDQVDRRDTAADHFLAVEAPTIDVARVEVGVADTAGVDGQTGLDGLPAMDALPSVVGFPCRSDDDCCTAVDACMARTYLYSRAPGANPPPTFPVSTGGCLACIPSAVQLRCTAGQCFGERLSSYSGSLYNAHCGYVAQPDAGASVLFDVIDASIPVVATKTSWTCGG